MNQDQEPQKETRLSSFLKIIIWIVALLIIIGVGYFVYNQYFKKSNATVSKTGNTDIPSFVNDVNITNDTFTQADKDYCKKTVEDMTKLAQSQNTKLDFTEQTCLNTLLDSRHKAQEVTIKAGLAGLRSLAQNYYGEKSTYKGYDSQAGAQTLINNIAQNGSKVSQNITDKTFMVYALLPYSKTIFCVDINNAGSFANVVPSISPNQTACEK